MTPKIDQENKCAQDSGQYGYFEGIASDRGIAQRGEDSKALARFLGFRLAEPTPDHSTLSKARKRWPKEWHDEAFAQVLAILAEHGLIKGDTIGNDASTMDANAALRSLRRRVDGTSYMEYVQQWAAESGVAVPIAGDLARFDRKCKIKKCQTTIGKTRTTPTRRSVKQ